MPEVMFAGPDGRLEGRYHHSKEPGAPVALVLHPHPLHGGTMNNRITFTMYQSFMRMGCSVMRFNFRGVGRSQGRYDGGIGEISDAAAALDWMQAVNPGHGGIWIAGYSFGAFGDALQPQLYYYLIKDGKITYLKQAHPSTFMIK